MSILRTVPARSPQLTPGLDVSHHQGRIDWARVAATGAGFAFVRVSYGHGHPNRGDLDREWARNWAGAARLPHRGAYQFFRSGQDPIAQADLLLDAIANHGGTLATDLPPVLDLEHEAFNGWDSRGVLIDVHAWVDHVQRELDRLPLLYTSPSLAVQLSDELRHLPLWIADARGTDAPLVPTAWDGWHFWQHSVSGHLDGVGTIVDLNWFDGDLVDLAHFVSVATHPTEGWDGD